MAENPVLLNHDQMARAIGVSGNTLAAWRRDGCPFEQEGGRGRPWLYDPVKVKAWRDGQLADAADERDRQEARVREFEAKLDLEGGSDELSHLSAKDRREYYRAEQDRMVTDLKRGLLCRTDDVRRQFQVTFSYLADRLQALPDHLERRCALTPDTVAVLVEAVDEWQAELARHLSESDLETGDEDSDQRTLDLDVA